MIAILGWMGRQRAEERERKRERERAGEREREREREREQKRAEVPKRWHIICVEFSFASGRYHLALRPLVLFLCFGSYSHTFAFAHLNITFNVLVVVLSRCWPFCATGSIALAMLMLAISSRGKTFSSMRSTT